ncbi:MAG: N-formylglutamate amidohydrolase [Hyphomicrobiales bacterium]|uniref:N-formylglutamate amidohydrolase n=1 Tax=Rhabdaerophilum calidifontis TaxID=2604328 RepID=UPI001FEAA931|nr:N-formylglutamate amidohydrolase [Rhabdaerophilum calidifontis]MCA1953458.1 N-formylglutamate amidohydrolase [Hyphomicrobiales bacterium]MCA2000197.1 N-formylglutamate amidohydrolase [Hyphomicrobiales bacterium]
MNAVIHPESAPAFEIVGGDAGGGLLLLCDHAQASIPKEFDNLGLPARELGRHIAYDIGAEAVTRVLAAEFGAPAVMSRFSRLLIDPNRGTDDPTLVMRIADGAIVPGNARIDAAGIAARIARFYAPYDDAITRTITTMQASGRNPAILSMHSYTPAMKGIARPWEITVIWDFDPRLNRALLAALRAEHDLIVGENEPYQGGYAGDTIDRHCLRRGLAHALVEIRQDLIDTPDKAGFWGRRLARILRPVLADPTLAEIRHYGAHPAF